MKDCPICELINDPLQTDVSLHESEYWKITLSPNQKQLGRCYVTLKRHAASLAELTIEEWVNFKDICEKLEHAMMKNFAPTHFNWSCLMNNAIRDSQSTHVHWHFVPRYDHEIELFGQKFTDSDWPEKYVSTPTNTVSIDILNKIKDKISL